VLERAAVGMDRQDKIDEKPDRDAAEPLGRPATPRLDKYQLKAEHAAAAAQAEATPASKSDLSRLEQVVTQLNGKVYSLGGRP
jgi:hypothetical protein